MTEHETSQKNEIDITDTSHALVRKANGTIDIAKAVMSVLVVGIHTEPFGFNIWLDRGFGIATRLCVPFFFIASSYFFWRSPKSPVLYIRRIFLLYLIWCLIYLPFDLPALRGLSAADIAVRYLWNGNEHALWFLSASIGGFVLVYALTKILNKKLVFAISVFALIIGCFKTTWFPLAESLIPGIIIDIIGTRNGLYYAFPYMALGMLIARNSESKPSKKWIPYAAGFFISLLMLAAESSLFVLHFHTRSTLLWLSVLPCSYFLFRLLQSLQIDLPKSLSLLLRRLSTLIYVSHGLFLIIFSAYVTYAQFLLVLICTTIFSLIVLKLSRYKFFKWMKYLY